jgi:hypothetical protein
MGHEEGLHDLEVGKGMNIGKVISSDRFNIYMNLAVVMLQFFLAHFGNPTVSVIMFTLACAVLGYSVGAAMEKRWTDQYRKLAHDMLATLKARAEESNRDDADWWKRN